MPLFIIRSSLLRGLNIIEDTMDKIQKVGCLQIYKDKNGIEVLVLKHRTGNKSARRTKLRIQVVNNSRMRNNQS